MNDRIENGVIKKYYQSNKTLIYAAFGVLQSDHIYIYTKVRMPYCILNVIQTIDKWVVGIY